VREYLFTSTPSESRFFLMIGDEAATYNPIRQQFELKKLVQRQQDGYPTYSFDVSDLPEAQQKTFLSHLEELGDADLCKAYEDGDETVSEYRHHAAAASADEHDDDRGRRRERDPFDDDDFDLEDSQEEPRRPQHDSSSSPSPSRTNDESFEQTQVFDGDDAFADE